MIKFSEKELIITIETYSPIEILSGLRESLLIVLENLDPDAIITTPSLVESMREVTRLVRYLEFSNHQALAIERALHGDEFDGSVFLSTPQPKSV
ncbi:MAG: hypothetical protein WKF68_02515 [Daejeonella sp.]